MLNNAGFGKILNFHGYSVDHDFITALVERWRPETHTFHLPTGECTVTLEDVHMLLGLRVDGKVVTGRSELSWKYDCLPLLGEVPDSKGKKGNRFKITWLKKFLKNIPNEPSDDQLIQYSRAYILYLIGTFLMPNKSSDQVHMKYVDILRDLTEVGEYSWGSAILATLYKNLCDGAVSETKTIAGCTQLLQAWGWSRLKLFSPINKGPIVYPYINM